MAKNEYSLSRRKLLGGLGAAAVGGAVVGAVGDDAVANAADYVDRRTSDKPGAFRQADEDAYHILLGELSDDYWVDGSTVSVDSYRTGQNQFQADLYRVEAVVDARNMDFANFEGSPRGEATVKQRLDDTAATMAYEIAGEYAGLTMERQELDQPQVTQFDIVFRDGHGNRAIDTVDTGEALGYLEQGDTAGQNAYKEAFHGENGMYFTLGEE